MGRQIVWTKRASEKFEAIQRFLIAEWSEKVCIAFVKRTDTILKQLSDFPTLGTLENQALEIHAIVLSKHNTLFYRFDENRIYVLNIFDTRQSPQKKKY